MKQSRINSFSEDAVSPVVGVMLMLVVTIIIAAVVSGFAGGLASTTEKAPTISMEVEIANGGHWTSSHFSALVLGVDKGIPTKDIKIVTKWSKEVNGSFVSDGATVVAGETNTHLHYKPFGWGLAYTWWDITAPQGHGPGVDPAGAVDYAFEPVNTDACTLSWGEDAYPDTEGVHIGSWFGNYNLVTGTAMYAEPFGAGPNQEQGGFNSFAVGYGCGVNGTYEYTYGLNSAYGAWGDAEFTEDSIDQMMAVLGEDWYLLRTGDTVQVSLVHIPSGKVIWQKDVTVEG